MINKIFVIDICGTIFKSNTTFDFIKFYYASRFNVRILSTFPVKVVCAILFKLFGIDVIRPILLRNLEGVSHFQLKNMADEFYDKFLLPKKNNEVINIINQYRAEGYRLILVSATIDVIATVVAEKLAITEFISTNLEYEKNICTGKILKDVYKNKQNILIQTGLLPPYAGIITDNYEDVTIIEQSKEPYLVSYRKTASQSKNKWREILSPQTYKRCKILNI